MSEVTTRTKVKCPKCLGKGKVLKDKVNKIWQKCPKCQGKTYIIEVTTVNT